MNYSCSHLFYEMSKACRHIQGTFSRIEIKYGGIISAELRLFLFISGNEPYVMNHIY